MGFAVIFFKRLRVQSGLWSATRYWDHHLKFKFNQLPKALSTRECCLYRVSLWDGEPCLTEGESKKKVLACFVGTIVKNCWLSVSPALCQGRLVGFSYIWNMCLSIKVRCFRPILEQDFNHRGLASLVYQTGLDWRQRWHNGRWPRRMSICGEEPMSCGKVVSILVAKKMTGDIE